MSVRALVTCGKIVRTDDFGDCLGVRPPRHEGPCREVAVVWPLHVVKPEPEGT